MNLNAEICRKEVSWKTQAYKEGTRLKATRYKQYGY